MLAGTTFLDFGDTSNCFNSSSPQFAIVFERLIASFLEIKAGVDGQFFASRLTESLGPSCLTWVLSFFEGTMAF